MRLRLVLVMCLLAGLSVPHLARASSPTAVLELSELLPDPASPLTDEHDEFTEIHNTASVGVNLAGYQIKVGTHVYTFSNVTLDADGYLAVASGNSTLSLANSGGTVTLLAPDATIIDTATYATAKTGWSWAKINGNWQWTSSVTPGAANVASATSPSDPTPTPGTGGTTGTSTTPASSFVGPSPILISELLPDPAAPLTDAHDEFIELLNPSDTSLNLAGYVLKAGSTLSSHFSLTGTVTPGGYVVFTSATDHLQLANAGSSVALFDPTGTQVDATVKYGAAPTGQAWARFADGWAWTTTPTPGTDNVLSTPPAKVTASSSTTSAKTASKPKASTAKKLTTKAASTVKTAAATTTAAAAAAAKGSGLWLLLLLLGLTIGFVSYEFRHDILDLYHRAHGYRRRRRQASR